jgi:hypothetical protein
MRGLTIRTYVRILVKGRLPDASRLSYDAHGDVRISGPGSRSTMIKRQWSSAQGRMPNSA